MKRLILDLLTFAAELSIAVAVGLAAAQHHLIACWETPPAPPQQGEDKCDEVELVDLNATRRKER